MFGTREAFEYVRCSSCGCLQIAEVPDDLAQYYPPDYYSFDTPLPRRIRRLAKRQRLRHALGFRSLGGAFLTRRYGSPQTSCWLAPLHLSLHSRILEVGSGAGHLLFELRDAGFSSLTGLDPFAPREIRKRGLRVLRKSVHEVEGSYDAIMLHHTFEHLPDPAETLGSISRLLAPNGQVLLRIPVADSYAFRTYGPNWVQVDAPRHLFLHTRESIQYLAGATGLTVREVLYDSSAFQFWGSEQYRRDIPLSDPRSHAVNPEASSFRPEEIAGYEHRADELNRQDDGDQACYYLIRSED